MLVGLHNTRISAFFSFLILALITHDISNACNLNACAYENNPAEFSSDSTRKIMIVGQVTHKRAALGNSEILVYADDELLLKEKIGLNGAFIIHLDVEKLFKVEVTNPDFHPKVFRLATHVWNSQEEIYPVEMFVDLFGTTEAKVIKHPERFSKVPTLYYNQKLGFFENNEPRVFALNLRFLKLSEKLKKRRDHSKRAKKRKNNQLKILKSRPNRLSKYSS